MSLCQHQLCLLTAEWSDPLLLGLLRPGNSEQNNSSVFLDTSKIRGGPWIQTPSVALRFAWPFTYWCSSVSFGLQDSDSPRHSTASNSSNLSSPPSPVSPHKTKSLSLESSDHVSWDSWTASAFRFDITAACCPHGCPLHLLQFSPSSS